MTCLNKHNCWVVRKKLFHCGDSLEIICFKWQHAALVIAYGEVVENNAYFKNMYFHQEAKIQSLIKNF